MPRQRPSAADRTGPYLESLDSSASAGVVAMEWARYLVDAFGTAGAVRALQHYEDVGWISPSVRRAMTGHLDSPSADGSDEAGADAVAPADLPGGLASLAGSPFEKHARSLAYVAAIADDSLPGERPSVRAGAGAAGSPTAGTTDATGVASAADGASAASDSAASSTATEASTSERVGIAGSVDAAGTFHLLADDGSRSRCGILDSDSETAHDVAAVLPRDDAAEAGLSLCGSCRERAGE